MGTDKLSPSRRNFPVYNELDLVHRGKVRDTYDLGDGKLLIVVTSGISIFDFVLDAVIPGKGEVLTAMSHFWFKKLEEQNIKTHLIAAGSAIDAYLPETLRDNSFLQSRAMVVRKLEMTPREFIMRGYLTGSGLTEYKEAGTVCGHELPEGLQDGDKLEVPIDTPTSKAEEGHDEHLYAAQVREEYSEETELLFEVYKIASEIAEKAGIIIADTKVEAGRDKDGVLYLGDEVLTPDSSRFWPKWVWKEGRAKEVRKAPPSFDKQFVRDAGIKEGINKLDPANPNHVARAQSWAIPERLIRATTQIYRYIFWRLTGMRLEKYQREVMGIDVSDKQRELAVVFGSTSDIPMVEMASQERTLQRLKNNPVSAFGFSRVRIHVISCHRNLKDLTRFARDNCWGADVVIAAGGKAFAMPGILTTLLDDFEFQTPVIGVALGKADRSLSAAILSIEELPGQPVVMLALEDDSPYVHTNSAGFWEAVQHAAYGEFMPRAEVKKQAHFDIDPSKFV